MAGKDPKAPGGPSLSRPQQREKTHLQAQAEAAREITQTISRSLTHHNSSVDESSQVIKTMSHREWMHIPGIVRKSRG